MPQAIIKHVKEVRAVLKVNTDLSRPDALDENTVQALPQDELNFQLLATFSGGFPGASQRFPSLYPDYPGKLPGRVVSEGYTLLAPPWPRQQREIALPCPAPT